MDVLVDVDVDVEVLVEVDVDVDVLVDVDVAEMEQMSFACFSIKNTNKLTWMLMCS